MNRLIALAAVACIACPALAAPHAATPAPTPTEQVVVQGTQDLDPAYVHPEDGAAAVVVKADDTLSNGVSVLDSQGG